MRQSTRQFPIHLAMIMDGNGRWAEKRGLPRWGGHRAGAVAVRRVVARCAERGVRQLTLYAFSSDNWKRPRPEVSAIMALCEHHLRAEADRLAADGIRVSAIGRRDRLPTPVLRALEACEARTARGRRMELRLALDYSSRAAIATSLGTHGANPTPSLTLVPPVDMMVRTGGERRLSDFLLWECAYAELSFLDDLWPDLTAAHVDALLDDYARRERRFGAIPEKVQQRASA